MSFKLAAQRGLKSFIHIAFASNLQMNTSVRNLPTSCIVEYATQGLGSPSENQEENLLEFKTYILFSLVNILNFSSISQWILIIFLLLVSFVNVIFYRVSYTCINTPLHSWITSLSLAILNMILSTHHKLKLLKLKTCTG